MGGAQGAGAARRWPVTHAARRIAPTLPALLRAYEIGSRVASVGFDWNHARDVVGKIQEEAAELRHAIDHSDQTETEAEMGDLLFTIANLSRKLGIEPEHALRRANDKFAKRFSEIERRIAERGLHFTRRARRRWSPNGTRSRVGTRR